DRRWRGDRGRPARWGAPDLAWSGRGDGATGGAGRAEGMIAVSSGLKVLIATKPVDFRKGMDGLAALVKAHLGADPFSGAVFVFRARRADRIKLIVWDGTGLCLFAKRLEQGTFRWPRI